MNATDHISSSDDQSLVDPFRVCVEPERDVVRVCPFGDVDLATVSTLRDRVQELAGAGFRHVVLDLRGVTFMDSSGLHLVIELDTWSQADGWNFAIIEGSPAVQRAFEVTGLRSMLSFVDATQIGQPGRTWR